MYSLSKPQEAIYYMSRYAENSIANIAGDVFYDFPVSIEEIHEAMISFLDKCEIMHTRIHHINGEPMQSIEKDPSYADIEIKTFANYNEYEKWANQEAIIPIQISDRLYRLYIIDINGKIGLFSVVHHLISDASSFAYIGKYVGRFLKGEKDITIYSYKEYLNAENEYKLTKRYEKDRGYWLNEYKNNTVNYFSKKETSNQSAARRSLKINQKLSHDIFLFCEKNNISEFVFFLSLIATLYYRTTMNNSFFIGTPVLNRYSNQEDNMLGVFVNTVPIGFSINETDTFNDICLRTADQVLSAFRHQKYHYTQLLKDISNEGYPSHRLFDVLLSFWNVKILKDSTANWFCNCNQTESLQIHIDDRKNDGFFSINYDYQTEKFSECDIDVLHEHICTLLHDAVNNENKSVAKLKILSSEEKQNFLSKFNDTFFEYSIPVGSTLYSLFEETAKKNANKVCIKTDGKEITFGEFLNIAEQLDTEIRTYTKGEKCVVGVIADRSIEMYAAIYGIIRGGNAYMPISPDYPQDRIEYMLKNSKSPLCIAQGKYCSLAGENHINMTDFIKNLPKKDVVPFACEEDDTAYVIYTSGSTGKPKGAKVSHKSAVNRILWMHDKYPLTEDGVILQKTPYTFDVSVWEIFWWGMLGGCLAASKPNEHFLPAKILGETDKNKVTHLHFVPSVFDLFLTHLESHIEDCKKFSTVKYVFLSGEALNASLIERFYKLFDCNEVSLHNLYGPTECAVDVTYYDCSPADCNPVPIGKPIYNTSMYVVDKYMKLVPVGVKGELCIGGVNVGQGYINNPELTAEKFIDNPFGEGKLYKTGDLAYWREDGEIIFCGRNDFQVKIRGQRIELGEIENIISTIPGVELCAVVMREDTNSRQYLCAFYTGNEIPTTEFRALLGEALPKYMVPHIFTHLNEMPLTSSGKISRTHLPQVNFEKTEISTHYVAPETTEEKALCLAIEETLGCEKVGMLDNFFDVGGDSLKAIELISKLEQSGFTVETKAIFDALTIKALAKKLITNTIFEEPIEYSSTLPATPAQMRVYTSQIMTENSAHYNIPYAFKVKKLNTDKLQKSVNELIKRHESLRTRFENRNGEIYQVIEENAPLTLTKLSNESISDFNYSFDLNTAPLLRIGYYENTVMVVLHHIIADGESLPIFFKELNELYMGRTLTNVPIQYGDFTVRESVDERAEKYWLDVFSDELSTLELPTDYPKGNTQSFNGTSLFDFIDIALHKEILKRCKMLNITPYAYYMACYNILLSKISGSEDICVGMPVSGRSSKYLDTIGMFVNTVALRSAPTATKTIYDFLQETKLHSVNAIHNQNYPLGELIKNLGPSYKGNPHLFDVMFAYQSEAETNIVFGDEKAELIPVSLSGVKCDIDFYVMPRTDDVVLMVDYATDLFKETSIRKFISAFKTVLSQALDSNTLIKDISVLNPEDTEFIADINKTEYKYNTHDNPTIYSLFEENAKKNADKVCIKAEGKDITFGEFLNIAEQLDTEIRTYTKGEKRVIGVIADRSIEMYAAIYGIIRGGNAYMPISPDYPQDRIAYMLENSNAPLVLTQGKYSSLAGSTPFIDVTNFIESTPCSTVLPYACEENDTAYVIYTSGSTGKPKGAKVSHKSAVNRILWMHDKYPLEENDVILQKTPYTFDVSVWEIFWWGMLGGSLAFSKPNEHFLPAKILDETKKNKVTHLHFVPSVFDLFLTHLEEHKDECEKFSTVKYVFLSGEALSASLVERFYKLFDYNKVTLHNLYGPTECAVDVTYYDCSPAVCDPVPIGKPIYNTSMYVVDKYMKLVPVGVKGELCIGGVNVGQGYLNNPELTAEKFIDNPFGEGKLYKTGDLAYWREDGEIVFCGRMDNQVKLNGQRIELGEIESVIASVNKVDSVAVLVHKAEGRDILVAVCCADSGLKTAIIDKCREKLPAYMIPQAFTFIDEMPLNQSGKLDRKYLSTLSFITEVESIEKPLNETEKLICDAFCKVLNIDEIGRNSDFFDLGGTSITMISVLSDGVLESITAPEFIANSTPSKLSQLLEHKRKPTFKYIQKLIEPENSSKAFILFPYAGSGAEIYSTFVKDFEKQSKDFALFFVDFLHTKEDCEKVAFEISQLAKTKEIYFYSHCAGSAVALQTLNIIEANELCSIKHYIAGGSIPLEKPSAKNTWNYVPNFILKRILVNAGAGLNEMDKHTVTDTLRRFRKDTDFMTAYFHSKSTTKVKCPLSLVMSKQDIFTKEYKKAQELWAPYAENLSNIRFIETTSHYFQATNSYELVNIILDYIK